MNNVQLTYKLKQIDRGYFLHEKAASKARDYVMDVTQQSVSSELSSSPTPF